MSATIKDGQDTGTWALRHPPRKSAYCFYTPLWHALGSMPLRPPSPPQLQPVWTHMMTPGHRLSITPTLLTMQSLHDISVGASLSHQIMMMAKSPQHAIPNNNNNKLLLLLLLLLLLQLLLQLYLRKGWCFLFFTFPFFFFLFDFFILSLQFLTQFHPPPTPTMFFPIYMMTIEVSPVVLGSPIQSFGLRRDGSPHGFSYIAALHRFSCHVP